jgi:hypothetical protein
VTHNLFISYQIASNNYSHAIIEEQIKLLGPWAKIQPFFWYVSSAKDSEEAAKILRGVISDDDALIVIDASSNNAYWYALQADVSKQLMDQWHK